VDGALVKPPHQPDRRDQDQRQAGGDKAQQMPLHQRVREAFFGRRLALR
jgi:hypothetical protein